MARARQRWLVTAAAAAVALAVTALAWCEMRRPPSEDVAAAVPNAAAVALAATAETSVRAGDETPGPARDGSAAVLGSPGMLVQDEARRSREDGARHTIDPCDPVPARAPPDGFEVTRRHGVTLAWDPAAEHVDEPVLLAYVAGGLLEEAGRVLGAPRRSDVTVIVYASRAEPLARTGMPSWTGGVYDGAVHTYAAYRHTFHGGLPVSQSALRHELMHAQLHTTVGCMPTWFNEGVADYFAGSEGLSAKRDWVRMLRERAWIAPPELFSGSVRDTDAEAVSRMYSQSLAMVLVLEHPGAPGIRGAVADLRAGGDPEGLWQRMRPSHGRSQLLAFLADRLFGMPVGHELDALLAEPVCCRAGGSAGPAECRAAREVRERDTWMEQFDDVLLFCFAD